jgi:hypothetical protein
MSDRATHWEVLGSYFGYPVCCIRQFSLDCCSETKAKVGDEEPPFYKIGFVPCMKCVDKAYNFTHFADAVIKPNRICSATLDAYTHSEEELDQYYDFHLHYRERLSIEAIRQAYLDLVVRKQK